MAHQVLVKEWLYKANQDFGFARVSLRREREYFDQVCFFLHQSAEKYFKAYIIKFDLKFEKEHNLLRLLEICKIRDAGFQALREACKTLNPFYFETRYPDQVFAVCSQGDAEKALRAASRIRKFIKVKLRIKRDISFEELKKEYQKIDKLLKSKISRKI